MAKSLSIIDLELHKFQGSVNDSDKQDNGVATATLAAQGAGTRMRVVKVDASYESSTVSGLLQIKSGSTVIREKYIHGSGAIDAGDMGIPANALNEAMSAVLAASGAGGTDGTVTIQGFWHPETTS